MDIVETYVSADDYPAAPDLVLHGSPLPLHVHVTWAWFQRTGDTAGLAAFCRGLRVWLIGSWGVLGAVGQRVC